MYAVRITIIISPYILWSLITLGEMKKCDWYY